MRTGVIDWQVKAMSIPGETLCGDQHAVVMGAMGGIVAAIDGSGHGADAALAGTMAAASIEANRNEGSLVSIVRKCHDQLQQTRGAALSLAMFENDSPTLTWIGVGNVTGVVLHDKTESGPRMETLLLRAGVVGKQLPPLMTATVTLGRGDLLLFATDGIDRNFSQAINVKAPLEKVIQDTIGGYRTGSDDALILAARYVG